MEIVFHCRAVVDHGVDPAPIELACTGFDPSSDLERRADRWQHRLEDTGLVELARFGAGLVQAEIEAWSSGDGATATQAFDDRRFLLGDRIVHWAVPWADVAGRCHDPIRDRAHSVRDHLLWLGDTMRIAPILTGDEGLHPPGEDSIGPLRDDDTESIGLLASGTILFAATMGSLTREPGSFPPPPVEQMDSHLRADLAIHYQAVAARWRRLSSRHPGTAMLWRDLARRAERTRGGLTGSTGRP